MGRFDPSLNVSKFNVISELRNVTINETWCILPNAPQRIWARVWNHGGGSINFSTTADPFTGPRLYVLPNIMDTYVDFTYENCGPIVQNEIWAFGNTAGMTISITQVLYFPNR